jgi:hypothetical protein
MICQKLNHSPIKTYSLPLDWEFIDPEDSDPMSAVSCDSVSDFAVIGLLNWQADGMMQRFQCCVVRRGDGFSRQVKYHIAETRKRSEWPGYYSFVSSVTVKIGRNSNYDVYGTLKAHVDIISFSMFTFNPHERRAGGGIAKWVLNDRRLEGINDSMCVTGKLLRIMGNVAFGYPVHLDCSTSGGSDARAYAEMLILSSGG